MSKSLASLSARGKLLIALHEGPGGTCKPVALLAASVPLKVFIVDHRADASRPVEVETVESTATDQDFREQVFDEIAEFTQNPAVVSSPDLKRLIEQINT